MRTTVDIHEDHRARLLEIAARRGERGYSAVLREAIEAYLEGHEGVQEKQKQALELRGRLSKASGKKLLAATRRIRKSWR